MLVKNIKKRKKESREILSPIFFETYESERDKERERENLSYSLRVDTVCNIL